MEELVLKFLDNPRLETERLILRKLDISDAGDIFEYASDPIVTRYMTFETHKTIDDAKGFINFVLDRYSRDESGEWGIELKTNSRLIGTLGIASFDQKNSCITIGYILAKHYWGKGIVTEAVKRVIRFAFDDMKVNRVEAYHFLGNDASGRVMQKAGMQYEGILRQKLFARGEYRDVKQYAILKDDWIGNEGKR